MLKTSLPSRISLKTCKRSSLLEHAGQKAGGSGEHGEAFTGSRVGVEILVLTPHSLPQPPGPPCLTLGMDFLLVLLVKWDGTTPSQGCWAMLSNQCNT